MNFEKLVVITNMPSPYQVDFFNALGKKVNLTVIYVKKTEPERKWHYEVNIEHDHIFLRGNTLNIWNNIAKKDTLFIVSGYNLPAFIRAMFYLTIKKIPWIFWGEKIRLNKLYVKNITVLKLLKHARAILGIGEVAARLYYETTKVPTFVFPYHINTERFYRRHRPDGSKINFLYSGQLIKRKGVLDIQDAFEKVYNDYGEKVHLHIVGDGPLYDIIKRKTSSYATQVHLYGFVRYEELPKIYQRGDIFLFPSLYDGWGVALAEGMAAGMVPIATFTTGAATDLILHGYNGFIIPPSQPSLLAHYMEKLVENPERIYKMGANAAQYVKHKNEIKNGVKTLLGILKEI